MHIESAEPNLLRSENADEGGKVHDSRNTIGSGPGAGRRPRFPPRSTTALYLAVPWLEIHMMESILPARAFSEAARCVVHLPDTGFGVATTVSVI